MRKIGYLLLGAAVALSLGACSKKAVVRLSPTVGAPASSSSASATVDTSRASDAATATAGHEQGILAAVPAALVSAAQVTAEQGVKMPDVSAATPEIASYILVARTGKLDYLFEVMGDGQAYELYRYPDKPNPAKLEGGELPKDEAASLVLPLGARETAAAAAVKAVMDKVPAADAAVFIYGYNIGFIGRDGRPVMSPEGGAFRISVDPSGRLVEI